MPGGECRDRSCGLSPHGRLVYRRATATVGQVGEDLALMASLSVKRDCRFRRVSRASTDEFLRCGIWMAVSASSL